MRQWLYFGGSRGVVPALGVCRWTNRLPTVEYALPATPHQPSHTKQQHAQGVYFVHQWSEAFSVDNDLPVLNILW